LLEPDSKRKLQTIFDSLNVLLVIPAFYKIYENEKDIFLFPNSIW